jgi:hypothetical protein
MSAFGGRRIAAEISGGGLEPLSDDERIERQNWREEQNFLAQERRLERERQQDEADAVARHEAALEQQEANRKRTLERQEQISRQVRDREIADLRLQTAQQRGWMINAENSARNAVAVRQRQVLIADIESHFNPPPPPPEPEVIYVEGVEGSDQLGTSDFNPTLWMQKSRSWW